MMHAASRDALASLRRRLDEIAGRVSAPDGLAGLARELYSVAELLAAQPRLRRILADPTTPADGRADLAERLFDGQLGASSLEVVRTAVSLRWSSTWDLVDSLEQVADDALLVAADQGGSLDEVEDELFRFERVLDSESRLTTLLDELTVPAERRVELLHSVLATKVTPISLALLEHAVSSGRTRGIERAIDALLDAAATRRERSVARVISAVELTAEQQSRLGATLTQLYGRPISVRTAVEPDVQGGLVVRVGDEVIDGSVSAQLAAARAALAS